MSIFVYYILFYLILILVSYLIEQGSVPVLELKPALQWPHRDNSDLYPSLSIGAGKVPIALGPAGGGGLVAAVVAVADPVAPPSR